MTKQWTLAFSTILAGTILGCSQDSPASSAQGDKPQAASSGDQHAKSSSKASAPTAPGEVVRAFLDSLRAGEQEVAESLLTRPAREEPPKHGMVVKPPGSPQSTYHVGQVEYSDPQQRGAYVSSVWQEPGPNGKQSFEVIWVLRNTASGWRVAGMAAEPPAGGQPILFNFEDPADMLAKWRQADVQMASQPQNRYR